MEGLLHSLLNNSAYLGNSNAKAIFYLPNPPTFSKEAQLTTQSIIDENGNHWRKIFTIIAKLLSTNDDWRHYRDEKLLQDVLFCFNNQLSNSDSCQHFVCGKATWLAMGLEPADTLHELKEIADHKNAWQWVTNDANALLLPYPDYRQFNNKLIEHIRSEYLTS